MDYIISSEVTTRISFLADHLWQSGPSVASSVAAILGLEIPWQQNVIERSRVQENHLW